MKIRISLVGSLVGSLRLWRGGEFLEVDEEVLEVFEDVFPFDVVAALGSGVGGLMLQVARDVLLNNGN